jgi:coenzyme PQQ synthesis protein D (PqqD)
MSRSLSELRPARSPDVWIRKTRGETLAYHPGTGAAHLLNDTALAIWDLCDGETKPEEMVEAICQLCGMHPDVVDEDVDRILGEFGDAGLVVWVPGRQPS